MFADGLATHHGTKIVNKLVTNNISRGMVSSSDGSTVPKKNKRPLLRPLQSLFWTIGKAVEALEWEKRIRCLGHAND